MKISAFLDETNNSDSNAIIYTSGAGQDGYELVALNVPRTKTQSVKNTINLLSHRQIQEGQVVFSEGLEFRTLEAKGEVRSTILAQFMAEADPQSRVMVLLPFHGGTDTTANASVLSQILSTVS